MQIGSPQTVKNLGEKCLQVKTPATSRRFTEPPVTMAVQWQGPQPLPPTPRQMVTTQEAKGGGSICKTGGERVDKLENRKLGD